MIKRYLVPMNHHRRVKNEYDSVLNHNVSLRVVVVCICVYIHLDLTKFNNSLFYERISNNDYLFIKRTKDT